MKKISKAQKSIIYATLVAAGFLSVFWFFIYTPESRRLNSIKARLKDADAQIAEITYLTQGRDLSEAVKELNMQFAQVAGRFPAREEEVISNLSEGANKFKIEIKHIAFTPKRMLEARIDGYAIEEFPVTMTLAGEYRAIGEYVRMLGDTFGPLVKLQQLDIKGRGEGQVILDATLQLAAYLAKEKP